MLLQILLIISIVLQLAASIIAMRLTRRTKFNISWILFSVALTVGAFMLFGQYYQLVADKSLRLPVDFFVWLSVVTSSCFAVGLLYVNKIIKDIARREAQQRLTEKRILNTVLRTEERERTHFSKELHDGLGPLLASAKMSLSTLEDGRGDTQETIRNLAFVIDESIRSLREISNNLSPHTLKDFGLERAIRNYINKTAAISSIETVFDCNIGQKRYDNNVEIILFRVISELMANSMRHSGANRIQISVQEDDGTITIDYSDNGKGFDPKAALEVGMGLPNIYSRIRSLKGSVNLTSTKGEGMRAVIAVKLDNAAKWR